MTAPKRPKRELDAVAFADMAAFMGMTTESTVQEVVKTYRLSEATARELVAGAFDDRAVLEEQQ
jgi:hypothetical protein